MKTKNPKKYLISFLIPAFLIIFSFVLVLSNVSAIGFGPGKYEIVFSPGESQTLGFTALNNADTPIVYNVYTKGELAEYITCSSSSLSLKARETARFSCILNMPESLGPGPHLASVGIIESAPSSSVGQIAVLSAVESRLTINVPYPNFYISLGLSVNNTNINEPASIQVKAKNLGGDNITIQIPIEIMFGEEVVGNVMTEEKFIESMKEETFDVEWVADVANAGKYDAVASLVRDGETFSASKSFLVGDLIVNIINLTSEIYPKEIGAFNLSLQNMWSESVDVDVEIEVLKDNVSLGLKKEAISIEGFKEKSFKIFWDTPLQEIGVYQAKVHIYYGDKEKEALFDFEVKNREETKKSNKVVISILVAIGVIIVLVVLFFVAKGIMKKGRKKLKK